MMIKKLSIAGAAILAVTASMQASAALTTTSIAEPNIFGGASTRDCSPSPQAGATCHDGTDSSVLVFFTEANGSSFLDLTAAGVTVDSLLNGESFTVDISSVIGAATTWGLVGVSADVRTAANPNFFYGVNYGTIYAASSDGSDNGALLGQAEATVTVGNDLVTQLFDAVNSDVGGSGTVANTADSHIAKQNIDGTDFAAGNGIGEELSLWFLGIQQADAGDVASPGGLSGVSPVGNNIVRLDLVNGSLEINPVPVPAAAWLFGSALLGLGVVRRK